jgi:hypothetical protein
MYPPAELGKTVMQFRPLTFAGRCAADHYRKAAHIVRGLSGHHVRNRARQHTRLIARSLRAVSSAGVMVILFLLITVTVLQQARAGFRTAFHLRLPQTCKASVTGGLPQGRGVSALPATRSKYSHIPRNRQVCD